MDLTDPKQRAAYRQGWDDCLHEIRRRVADAITSGQMDPLRGDKEHDHRAIGRIEQRMLASVGPHNGE